MARSRGEQRTVRLPGIGDQLTASDAAGNEIVAVRRHDGTVALHASADLELSSTTAVTLGGFISGHFVLGEELSVRMSEVLGGLVFDWVTLAPGDRAIGRSILELEVRKRTGVTIVAILRGSLPIVAPDARLRLEPGDDLVIACREADRRSFVSYMTGGS